ncbi:MAG TPA: nitrophenyl compound nitroreductase subunit ArsF family protein [Prolixibacteraceae bacterium]|nr:nitrophenyl compound nitroreductase subunit ArsF family protein [Prolixibacteraceae bacterium]
MKKIILISVLFLFTGLGASFAQCCSSAAKTATAPYSEAAQQTCNEASSVEVVYFHATRRCATCMAVEEVTKEVLKANFANKITFTSIDREKDSKNELLKKHKVSGQTLLLIKGEKVIDLTNDAFIYARSNPDKFKEKLKLAIENM